MALTVRKSKSEPGRIGVLLVNLGTPEGTDYRSMRRYLAEFLSDPRVIEISPWLWKPLLQGVILNIRPQRSGRLYDRIWNRDLDESPLLTFTRAQAAGLQSHFDSAASGVVCDWAMRYGNPAIADRIEALQARGCQRILLVPLYPQYSASTTASVVDKAGAAMAALRHQPTLRTMPPYYADPLYIEALASTLTSHLATLSWQPDCVLASFHGLPLSYVERGDPYQSQCEATVRALRARLGWDEERLRLAYQSRVGRQQWIEPYTAETVRALARDGIRALCVITPGFAADCVETLEEIAISLRDTYLKEGGEKFACVPCLNDTGPGMRMLAGLVERELQGWLQA